MPLRVRLPDGLPAGDEVYSWALRDIEGNAFRAGADPMASLPESPRVELVAPAGCVLLTRAPLPRSARQRTPQMLRFAVEDRLTVEPEQVHVALGPRIEGPIHALAVVDRVWLRAWIEAFKHAGRAPESVLVETCITPLDSGTWTVVWRDSDPFVRTDTAGGMALDHTEGAGVPAMLQLALDDAVARGNAPGAIVVRPEGTAMPDLDAWSAALGVPCVAGSVEAREPAPPRSGIDLMQGEFLPASRLREGLPHLRPALIIGALALSVHVIGTCAHWLVLDHEKSRLQSDMRALFRSTFPSAQAVVDPPLQMQRQLNALRQSAGAAHAGDFLPLLAKAASGIAADVEARFKSASYAQDRLIIDVDLPTRSHAETLLRRLNEGGVSATLDAVNPKGSRIEARLALVAKGGA
ncbi:MAG TPA: type II secretion system protein GspL [Burkholderiales bacterium]|nr:type II secretion system protein GspL [Burkholderiales bacterium]